MEVDAFEDAGARWLVPAESVTCYQFVLGGASVTGAEMQALHGAPYGFDPEPFIETRAGWPAAHDWLADIAEAVTSGYVSNSWAGDLVLGHLIVLASLGLGTLTARAPRDPDVFAADWNKERRPEHIRARLASRQPCGAEPTAT